MAHVFSQDWNYTTTPQEALDNRTVAYARGKVLGGSTSISTFVSYRVPYSRLLTLSPDYMIYTRGAKDDYDRWASVTGDKGWSWDSMTPYLRKVRVLSS